MATTKHASIRYEVLDRCLQKQSEEYTEKMLRELCCEAIAEIDSKYEAAEISLRTFRSVCVIYCLIIFYGISVQVGNVP